MGEGRAGSDQLNELGSGGGEEGRSLVEVERERKGLREREKEERTFYNGVEMDCSSMALFLTTEK